MYIVLISLLVTASARDISQVGYNLEPRHRQFDRPFPNPPVQSNEGHIHEHYNYHSQNEHINSNNGEQFNNREQFNQHNNREFIEHNKNDRTHHVAYDNQGRSHDTGSLNLGFDRQSNRPKQGNLNMPRQSFNINNEYSNANDDRSHKYIDNILQARRQQDKVNFDDNNNRKTLKENHESTQNQMSNNGIVSLINNISSNANQNRDSHDTNINSNRKKQSGFKPTELSEDQRPSNGHVRPKATIENEVTQNPLENGGEKKEEDWVWGVEETTTVVPVTVDDRAAFSGDSCATGMVRFRGRCVPEE